MNERPVPIYITIAEGTRRWGVGRTKFYELLKANGLRTIKVGRRTLVDVRSGDAFFDALPSAFATVRK